MPRFESFKNISQGIFYWVILIVIGLIVAWLATSAIGNFVLDRQADNLKPPDVEKARYGFLINATNQTVFTNNYEIGYHTNSAGEFDKRFNVYTLTGYYEFSNGKYRWHKTDITLDEFYFGRIMLIDRGD